AWPLSAGVNARYRAPTPTRASAQGAGVGSSARPSAPRLTGRSEGIGARLAARAPTSNAPSTTQSIARTPQICPKRLLIVLSRTAPFSEAHSDTPAALAP